MSPLEEFLNHERPFGHGWRASLSSAVGGPSTSLSRRANRIIWPRRLKHMRYLAPGISLQIGSDQRFTIFRNRNILKECRSLAELIPPITTPTSIIATGPTSLDYPWDQVRNGERFLIAVNGAPTMLKALELTPDLFVVTDREFALTGTRHFEAAPHTPLAIEFLAAAALASTAPHFLTDRPVAIIERVNMWHGLPSLDLSTLRRLNEDSERPFALPPTDGSGCRIGWSHRPELGFFPGRTVVFGTLQISIRLGARDIEIIGMDLSGSGRSYDESAHQRPTQLQVHYEEFILPSFRIMSHALASSDVSVRNLSPVCPLPAKFFAANRDITQT